MQLLKNILGRLFALWAMLSFIISMLLFLIPITLIGFWPEPKRSRLTHIFFVAWMKMFFILSGVRRRYIGRQNFKQGENYVVVCNHNSFMDVPLTSPGIPGPNKTIAKVEMSRIPLFGIMYKRGSVLVDRKSEQSRKESYNRMKEVLKRELHMCIYPEGTRNKTPEPLQRFHDGAFRLAVDTKKAVLPALIFYTNKVLPRHKTFYFWPRTIEMHFLPAVTSHNKTAEELKGEVFGLMKDYYVQHNR